MSEEKWEEVQGDQGRIIRWTEEPKDDVQAEKTIYVGTKIQGIYESKRENIGENAATLYNVRTEEHGLLSLWGSTVLTDKFNNVKEGEEVIVELTGTQKPKAGGKAYFVFKVMHRPGPMVEVGAGEESESEDDESEMPPM